MIIESLLDNDLYKFTMMQCVLHHFPSTDVQYKFICRDKGVDLRPYIPRIKAEIEHLCNLRFTPDELDYLRSLRFIKKDFVEYLENFQLKKNTIHLWEIADHHEGGKNAHSGLGLIISGSWPSTILLEVPLLAIISECFLADKSDEESRFREGLLRGKTKLETLKKYPYPIKIADFGTRRRYSGKWHEKILDYFVKEAPQNFIGTSNLHLAKKFNLTPIGTMAHEFIQAGQGLGCVQLKSSQQFMLETWAQEYRGDLGIALTDTINMQAFLRDFDRYLAKLYDGCRQDSGDPIEWGEKLIQHYQSLGINPITKTAVFSDGLTINKALNLHEHFHEKIQTSYGIGTHLTNDVGLKALSIVIKLISVNGNPVAKISDEPGKVICEDTQFLSYLKKVFKVA